MGKVIIGALAHVDAGKTTLCEAMLYKTNTIRTLGRVDHEDSFLDFNDQERNRGITIFNKEARFTYKGKDYIYLDTPGHNELKNESNRAINVIDVALLIINAAEDIPSDTITTYKSLLNKNIPVIIFLNKTDIDYVNKDEVFNNLKNKLDSNVVLLNQLYETVALNNEDLLDDYLNGNLDKKYVIDSIKHNDVIPVFFGSALKNEGIDTLLDFIDEYISINNLDNNCFKGYVYKITYENKEKLTHIKVLEGTLHNKDLIGEYKINEIRLYSGQKYESVKEVHSNDLCALKGLDNCEIGMYLPLFEKEKDVELTALTYELKSNLDAIETYNILSVLNETQPELDISLEHNHIYIKLTGELQKEIIANLIKERFNLNITYSDPVIRYKETINNETYGIGHFEPLRHYGEVVVSIKPFDNGIKIKSLVNNSYTGTLINYLNTYHPKGILTNSLLTNIEITIVDYKTHPKHTEGQDLIESLRRAIRHALTKNESILLEPYYLINIDSNMEIINSIIPELNNSYSIYTLEENSILAKIPLTNFNSFILSLKQKLRDKLNYEIIDTVYDKAIKQDEVIERINYDYSSDRRNPAGSIFTSKGAGHYVDPENVEEMMHLNLSDYFEDYNKTAYTHNKTKISEEELKRVWDMLYKPKPRVVYSKKKEEEQYAYKKPNTKPIMYLVDGYNLMYFIDELKDIAKDNFMMAREKVIDIVSDFKGYVSADVTLVFDAYKQDGYIERYLDNGVISIVYTKSKQTADTYIEETALKLKDEYKVITVTSDYLEQMKLVANDSFRMSSREFMIRYENFKKNNYSNKKIPPNRPLMELRNLLIEVDD